MNKFTKTIAGVLGFAVVLSLVVVATATPTKADTISDLQAQIAALTAQLSKLAGSSAVVSSTTFNTDLTVGSKGADVTALQNFLISAGYSIPAGATGYFGTQTKAAVIAYQTAKGITPAAGYFGPKTRASVNGSVVVTSTPAASTGVVADGTDGSLTASQSSYVSSGVQVKKGETKNVLAIKLKATSGAVSVTRADVHFNVRPWLIFSQLVLKDVAGNVVATKTLSSAADATEITVGSEYLVRFDNVNYKVTPGTDGELVVAATVLGATDKITNGQTVQVTFGANGLRTENGKGYTDSVSGDALGTATVGSNTFTLSSTGSVADIYSRISPNSPAARQQSTSLTQVTSDVVLGTLSLKSANNSSTLNTLIVAVNNLATTTSTLSNVRLFNGSTSFGGTISGNAVTFSNLNVALAQDNWQDLTIKADVAASTTGTTTSITLTPSTTNIVVTDANYNTATIETGAVTSNTITFTVNALTVSAANATLGSAIIQGNNTVGYNTNYQFTLTNTSNSELYVSATSSVLVATSTTGTAGSSTLASIQTVSPASYSSDLAGVSYVIPAGMTRSFTLTGAIRGVTGQTGVNLKVTSIVYGTVQATPTGSTLTTGLENLVTTASF
ncbi:MAG: peptidoglycan-binding domain-containing protein [Candidatus Paceibacterota bacterium]